MPGLRRRWPRELRAHLARYLALFCLMFFASYVIVSVAAAAESLIRGSESHAAANALEDGDFACLAPLSPAEEQSLAGLVVLEPLFYLDFRNAAGQTLRVMREREQVDRYELMSGRRPTEMDELVVERLFAERNGLVLGQLLSVGQQDFRVVGIGTSPDYDTPLQNLSDVAAHSQSFGTAFVTAASFERLEQSGQAPETFVYAYRLKEGTDEAALERALRGLKLDYAEVTDPFLREFLDRSLGRKERLSQALRDLQVGTRQLADGLRDLEQAGDPLRQGSAQIFAGMLGQTSSVLSDLRPGLELTPENWRQTLGDLQEDLSALTPFEDLARLGLLQAETGLDELERFDQGVRSYTEAVGDLRSGSAELARAVAELRAKGEQLLADFARDGSIPKLSLHLKRADNVRIFGAARDLQTNRQISLFAGVILMLLFAYVMSIFVLHQLREESPVIGTLTALGLGRRTLICHYSLLPALVSCAGGFVGTLAAFTPLGIDFQRLDTESYYSLPSLPNSAPLYLWLYGTLMPALLTLLVCAFLVNRALARPAIALIRGESAGQRRGASPRREPWQFFRLDFLSRFQLRQLLRESRSVLSLLMALVLGLLIWMIGLSCYVLCANVEQDMLRDNRYGVMTLLKFPPEQAPPGTEAAYVENFRLSSYGFTLNVPLMGIQEESLYFDAKPIQSLREIVISEAMQEKYRLSVGDQLILSSASGQRDYVFTVGGVSTYRAGLMAFMDIDAMRELFGREAGYFNVLFSEDKTALPAGRLLSENSRTDIEQAASVFLSLMLPLVSMLMISGCLVFGIVLFLMLGVIVDHARQGMALTRMLGFRAPEVAKLYLDGLTRLMLLSLLIVIPLSKKICDLMYPYMISNVAVGIKLDYEPWYYAAMYAGIMLIYFMARALLLRRIRRIPETDFLKGRV